jgi:hypothetical protein
VDKNKIEMVYNECLKVYTETYLNISFLRNINLDKFRNNQILELIKQENQVVDDEDPDYVTTFKHINTGLQFLVRDFPGEADDDDRVNILYKNLNEKPYEDQLKILKDFFNTTWSYVEFI